MDSTTIAWILGGLAVLAYYTDPFGWDPSRKHERMGGMGPRDGRAALIVLAAGLYTCFHFDLLHLDSFDSEYEYGMSAFSEITEDFEPTFTRLQVGFGELGRMAGETASDVASRFRATDLAPSPTDG